MAKLIFPNCSYFVGFNLSPAAQSVLEDKCKALHLRSVFEHQLQDLEMAFRVMHRLVICFVSYEGLSADDKEKIFQILQAKPVVYFIFSTEFYQAEGLDPHFVGLPPEKQDIAYIRKLNEGLESLIPKGIKNVVSHGAQTVAPQFFSGIQFEFKESPVFKNCNHQLIYFAVVDDLIAQCILRADTEALQEKWPHLNEDQTLNNLKEMANQFLGQVNLVLAKISVFPKIGLPNVFDLRQIPEVQTSLYFPSVVLSDTENRIHISLGYVQLENEKLFDLSAIEIGKASDEIEFL